jgi:ABC-type sulfate transport system permease component
VLLGVPGAYCSTGPVPGRRLLRALVMVPFVLPTVVVGWRSLAAGPDRALAGLILQESFVWIVARWSSHYSVVCGRGGHLVGAARPARR